MDYIFTARIGHNVSPTDDNTATEYTLTETEIAETAFKLFNLEAFTMWEAKGFWGNGYETTTVIEVCGLTETQANDLCDLLPELATRLRQTSIYGTITQANCRERKATEYQADTKTA